MTSISVLILEVGSADEKSKKRLESEYVRYRISAHQVCSEPLAGGSRRGVNRKLSHHRAESEYQARLPQRTAGKLDVDSIVHRAIDQIDFSVSSSNFMEGKSLLLRLSPKMASCRLLARTNFGFNFEIIIARQTP